MRAEVVTYSAVDLAHLIEENPSRIVNNIISVGGQTFQEGKKVVVDGLTDTKQVIVVAQTIARELGAIGFKITTIY